MMQVPGQTCPKCGISGIHACPGKPLPPPTPEDEARIRAVFENLPKVDDSTTKPHGRLA